jgi:hypothetical protein
VPKAKAWSDAHREYLIAANLSERAEDWAVSLFAIMLSGGLVYLVANANGYSFDLGGRPWACWTIGIAGMELCFIAVVGFFMCGDEESALRLFYCGWWWVWLALFLSGSWLIEVAHKTKSGPPCWLCNVLRRLRSEDENCPLCSFAQGGSRFPAPRNR